MSDLQYNSTQISHIFQGATLATNAPVVKLVRLVFEPPPEATKHMKPRNHLRTFEKQYARLENQRLDIMLQSVK